MNYGFTHNGEVFTPDGKDSGVSPADLAASNKQKEAAEIAWLKTHPDKVLLYVVAGHGMDCVIGTWMGTVLDKSATMGPKRYVGFGYHTYRRHIHCILFGQRYHGWYMESSGDYCRLKKSKS